MRPREPLQRQAGGRSFAAVLDSLLFGVPHVRPARANVGFLGSVPGVLYSSPHTIN